MKSASSAETLPPTNLAALSWVDVQAYLKRDSRIVVPMGATEEHAHLSLATDTLLAERVTSRACAQAGVLVSPTIPFGCSAFSVNFPGTISLRTTTMCAVVEDVVDCLYRQGFRRIVFVTAHGGNEVITGCLSEVQLDRPQLSVHYRSAGRGMSERRREIEKARGFPASEHASWIEAFDFTSLGEVPAKIKEFPKSADFPSFPLNPRLARRYLGDGVQGGAYTLNDQALMNELLDLCVDDLAVFLRSLPSAPPDE